MEKLAFLRDDNAVSPVIGVVLLVAISVMTMALVGSIILSQGGIIQPSPDIDVDYIQENDDDNVSVVVTSLIGTSSVDEDNFKIRVDGHEACGEWDSSNGVGVGNRMNITGYGDGGGGGCTDLDKTNSITVILDGGAQSELISTYDVREEADGGSGGSTDTDEDGDDGGSTDTDEDGDDGGSTDTDEDGDDGGSTDTDEDGDDGGSTDDEAEPAFDSLSVTVTEEERNGKGQPNRVESVSIDWQMENPDGEEAIQFDFEFEKHSTSSEGISPTKDRYEIDEDDWDLGSGQLNFPLTVTAIIDGEKQCELTFQNGGEQTITPCE
ncbi:type IV pilin [Natronorubrum thiooxidans]|uniref:Flagellin (Archaellin), FlaG/FlaF family n=1 Tax=Natronorubrum thiooxidans TaxID=308853 RepID=A0A1N7H822_9EURY|nr:type IV pilin N-terminal domain-containing protein [Natronorubrum thiooxidans]SIS20923.1 flagellin (archaellin), FlaG/FlaF family [Natronorubrum thiooxidans]